MLAFFGVPFAASEAAWAAGKEAKQRAAKTACLSGDYAKGVALLAELFVSTRDAIYLFNQGRCFEQNGRYEEAIVRFREYQRKVADAGRAPDAAAEKHIADCQELLDKKKPVTPLSPPAANTVAESAPPSAPLPVASAIPATPTDDTLASPAPADLLGQPNQPTVEPETEGRPFYKTWWFWTAVGTAVAAGTVTAFLLTRRSPDNCDGLGMRCVEATGQ